MSITIEFSNTYLSEVFWEPPALGSMTPDQRKLMAIVDPNAKWYFDEFINAQASIKALVLSGSGEEIKSHSTVNAIHEFLFKEGADRHSLVIAVGGGAVLDTVGFAASCFKRGIDWVAIPTTLLAHVDASVGGKTAINHPKAGKNVIGSFHPPKKVFVDSVCSRTWTPQLRLEGFAEIYKIFEIFDHSSRSEFVKMPTSTHTRRSIELKAAVVRIDPYEASLRAILNYGHTFGHAIEAVTGMPHGVAVALGMRLENQVAFLLGTMQRENLARIDRELNELGFPPNTGLPPFDKLLPYLHQDKKNVSGRINLALVSGEAEVELQPVDPRVAVDPAILEQAYNAHVEAMTPTA